MNNNCFDTTRWRKVIIAVILILSAAILCFSVIRRGNEKDSETSAGDDEIQTQEEAASETEASSAVESEPETKSETEELIEYPAPEYEFTTEEVTIELDGVDEEYTIAWVSDLHLISDFEAGDELGDVHAEYLDALLERYETLPVTEDGVHADELWPEIVKYLNYNDFDGVIFGGDMMDYCSNSNIALIKEGLDSLRMRYIYVRADHDYGAYYGGVFFTETEAKELHKAIDNDESSNKFWDMGGFLVLGIDNSTKDMPDYYLNMVSEVLTRGKPVIMATHVPYEPKLDTYAASLSELSMQVRSTIYYWSTSGELYNPNTVTSEYLELIYGEDTAVCQVLSGHLHASWDGMLTQQVPQHIFDPAFSGSIGIIHIVPKG